ncbi:MAG: ATP-dependent metallopeptidase FtsH/Yme1/Tma family protein [Deltaproteobacteria bacterium]|nr:MAG: ATP-dependent metallopeptidase FtsH/Yme1/Tma family protein [Deltaproteobacteria bacterium]
MNPNPPRWPAVVGILFLFLLVGWLATVPYQLGARDVTWTEFKQLVVDGEIEKVTINAETGVVTGTRKAEPVKDGEIPPNREVRTNLVANDEGFVPLLEDQGVAYQAAPRSGCESSVLLMMLPLAVVVLFWVMMSRRDPGGRGMAAFGRSSAQLVPEDGTGVTFDDVAGVEEAAEELREVVSFLKTPEKFTALGGRPPKGVLLVGPPGTGKTLLARAVAGEAQVAFFSISGSNFVEMFVGVGAARVRDLFKNATEHAPCIVFIDELDAVGRSRSVGGPGGNEEREQTLNQLLVEMDGFDNRRGIIVMAATNRPEILDPALLRPGRFDRQVVVDRPGLEGRKQILEVHGKKLVLGGEVNLEEVAKLTPGFAGADLANMLNEAAILAARRDASAVEMEDIKEAIERTVVGLEKKTLRLSDKEKRIVAYHECGHAIAGAASPGSDPVQRISIIPRGIAALGYTSYLPEEDRHLNTKAGLLNRITMAFGGRAAEELVFGDVTNGASDDIRRASEIARKMVSEFGMSKRIGCVNYGTSDTRSAWGFPGVAGSTHGSPETAEVIESETRRILDQCHQRAIDILVQNRVVLEEMAMRLLEIEVLDGEEMQSFLSRVQPAESWEDRPTAEWIPAEQAGK